MATDIWGGNNSIWGTNNSIWGTKKLENIETTATRVPDVSKSIWSDTQSIWDIRKVDPVDPNPIVLAKQNDPYQINTVLDVLFNTAALEKRYKSSSIKARFRATGDLITEQYLNPMKQGKWNVVGLNTLTGLGETLDVLSNVVKSVTTPLMNNDADKVSYEYAEAALSAVTTDNCYTDRQPDGSNKYTALIDGVQVSFTDKDLNFYERIVNSGRTVNYDKLSLSERLKSSIGIGEYGRINYDYATGNTFADIVLEIISDPDTWITFGTSAAAKSSVDSVIGTTAETVSKLESDLLANVTDETAQKLIRQQIEEYAKGMSDKAIIREALSTLATKETTMLKLADEKPWIEAFLGAAVKEGSVNNTYAVQNLADAITVAMRSKGLLTDVDAVTARQMSDILQRSVGAAVNKTTLKTIRALDLAQHGTDMINKAMAIAALSPSGTYPVYRIIKAGAPGVGRWITKTLTNAAEINTNEFGNLSIMSYMDTADNFARADKVVKDALFDEKDLSTLYNTPRRITAFYAQMSQDELVISDLLEQYADDPTGLVDHIMDYVKRGHKNAKSLGSVIYAAENVQSQLARTEGVGDVYLHDYIKFLRQVNDAVIPSAKKLQTINKVNIVKHVNDLREPLIHASSNDFQQAMRNLGYKISKEPDWYNALYDSIDEIRLTAQNTQQELYDRLVNSFQPLLSVSNDIGSAAADTLARVKSELELWADSDVGEHFVDRILDAQDPASLAIAISETPMIETIFNDAFNKLDEAVDAFIEVNDKNFNLVYNNTTGLRKLKDMVEKAEGTYNEMSDTLDKVKRAVQTEDITTPTAKQALDYFPALRSSTDMQDMVKAQNLTMDDIAVMTPKEVLPHFLTFEVPDASVHFPEEVETWLNTTLDDTEYTNNWWLAQDALTRELNIIRTGGVASSSADQATVVQLLDQINTTFKPDYNSGRAMFNASETYFVIKKEQTAAYLSIVENPQMVKAMSDLRSGPMRRILEQNKASEAMELADQFYINRSLLQTISTINMPTEAKQGILASVQRLYNINPESLSADIDYWLDKTVYNAESYVRQSKSANQRFSLDFIRANYKDDYLAFRSLFDRGDDVAAHTADEDIITSLFVFYQLKDSGDKTAQALYNQGYRIVGWDLETQGVQKAAGNVIHQGAVDVIENDHIVNSTVLGLQPDVIANGLMPAPGYLEKLNITPEQYLASRGGDAPTEKDLVLGVLQNLWNGVSDTYDEAADSYKSVLLGHNITEADIPWLKGKMQQYHLGKDMQAAGITDLNFLDKVAVYDTLKYSQAAAGVFTIGDATKEQLKGILQNYADDMLQAHATKLFSAPSVDKIMRTIDQLKDLVNESKDSELYQVYNDIINSLTDSMQVYWDIGNANKALRQEPIARSLMLNVMDADGVESMPAAVKELWLNYKRETMSEKAFNESIGSGKALSPSAIFGTESGYQSIAYKYLYDADKVNNFFQPLVDPRLDMMTLAQRQGISKVLQRTVDRVQYPELYLPYYDQIREAIQKALKDPEHPFAYLSQIRTDSNSIQQDYAILRYMAMRQTNPTQYRAWMSDELYALATQPMTWLDWSGINKYEKYLSEGHMISKAHEYALQVNSLLGLRQDIDQFGRKLDVDDMWNAAQQLQVRALNASADLAKAASTLADDSVRGAFTRSVSTATRNIVADTRNAFMNLSAPDATKWLAHSHGFVAMSTADMNNAEAVLQKFLSAEYAEQNISAALSGDHLWVWLNKNSNWTAYLDNETGKILFSVNNQNVAEDFWRTFSNPNLIPDGLTEHPIATEFLEKFDTVRKQLDYITDGRAGYSAYDILRPDAIDDVFAKMPKEMSDTFFDLAYVKRGEMWQGAQFNHSLLGWDNSISQRFNQDIVSSLLHAMEYNVKNLSTTKTYTAALLDPLGGIAQTPIAKAYSEAPQEVFEYLKAHPEIVLVVPEASDKGAVGVRVAAVALKHQSDLDYAIANNARIMTSTVYNKLYEVLNDNIYSDTALAAWQSIMRTYKVGYLTTPGTWARNGYDAYIKNMLSTSSDPVTTAKAFGSALTDLNNYNDVVAQLYFLGDGKMPDVDDIEAFFQGYKKMSYERFAAIHQFSMTAAAGGEASVFSKMHKAQQENYIQSLLANGGISSDAAQALEQKRAWQHITNQMLAPMGFVERVARLAEYDLLSEKGFNKSKIIDVVEKTHFSYDTKSPIEQTMELIIPFYTFMSRNFEYWTQMIEQHPSYLSVMRDVLDPAWDIEQYDEDQLVENDSLNNQVMNGNIRVGDTNYFLNMSFSFMDTVQLLTDPLDSMKSSVFSPVQSVLSAAIQQMSNNAYLDGSEVLSQWIQNTFGAKPTEQQIRDKYGDWADTYMELYSYRVAGMSQTSIAQRSLDILTFIPVIGATLSRFLKTGIYYDDETALGKMSYLTGMATSTNFWEDHDPVADREKTRMKINDLLQDSSQAREVWAGILQQFGVDPTTSLYSLDGTLLDQLLAAFKGSYKKLNSQLYDLLQSDDTNVWMYTRLKAAMGYGNVSMEELPTDVGEAILAVMQGNTPSVNIVPVLQDQDTMSTMWQMLAIKFDVPDDFNKIPTDTLNKMYYEVARGAVALTKIMDMLSNDASTRYSYAVAKNKLGLDGLKLSQLPADALELIESAMLSKHYGIGRTSSKGTVQKHSAAGATSRRRVYHTKTYVTAAGTGLYDTKKGVYANYGHRAAQSSTGTIYKKNYARTGTRRMQLRMLGITPDRLNEQLKTMFYYYK